jgi:transposase
MQNWCKSPSLSKDHIVDSDGNTYNWTLPETKRLQKTLRKTKKCSSHGRKRTKNYKKRDTKNKFAVKMRRENDVIAVQDENIAG